MDDIPLPEDPSVPETTEQAVEQPLLVSEGPQLPSEPSPYDVPLPMPAEPATSDNPPIPTEIPSETPSPVAPPAPLEEVPAPPASLMSLFLPSESPKSDDVADGAVVHGPSPDPNNIAAPTSTGQFHQPGVNPDGACVFPENQQPNHSTTGEDGPNFSVTGGEQTPAPLPKGDQPSQPPMAEPIPPEPSMLAPATSSAQVYPNQPGELQPGMPADAAAAAAAMVGDPALQSGQVQYSASYMGYHPQMSDASMMHNYSYMTNSSYADYVNMYHAGRMSRYSNSYASYQGYNYSYPHMQQMYDGRNMAAAYATGSYSQQILPGTAMSMSNFTPPLPTDYKAPAFSSEPPQAAKKPSAPASAPAAAAAVAEKAKAEVLAEGDLPPLPEGAMPDQPKENAEATKIEEDIRANQSAAPSEAIDEDESDRMITDQDDRFLDNLSEDVNRYSPSLPMDEDEANQQSASVDENAGAAGAAAAANRPSSKVSSVLGKAQAKKRLMAFSISKQAAAASIAAKKQAQASSTVARDKKENGDGLSGGAGAGGGGGGKTGSDESSLVAENVFEDKHSKKKQKKSGKMEKARETIEEIEEIKRNEMSTMLFRQNYDPANDHTGEHKREGRRRDRNRRRSRSYSRSRSRRRSRSRSRDRKSRRSDKKSRHRSRSRSRSKSGSGSRSSSQVEKKQAVKTTDIKSWADFVEAGFQLDRYRRVKFNENKNFTTSEAEKRKKEDSKHGRFRDRRSTSVEKEIIEEIRKKKCNMFETPVELKQPVVCVRDKGGMEEIAEFPSHIMQFTNTKPTLKYCQNLRHASLHFINRVQLLESVPDDIALLMKRFWNSMRPKRLKLKLDKQPNNGECSPSSECEAKLSCPVKWWQSDPLQEDGEDHIEIDDVEEDDEEINTFSTYPVMEGPILAPLVETSAPKIIEKAIAGVGMRKSRFEDAVEEKQGVSVVVRSRWDSDYEDSPKNTNDSKVMADGGEENSYRESPKASYDNFGQNPEGPDLPEEDNSYEPKSANASVAEEPSANTFVNKKHVLIEKRPKKNKDKSKRSSRDAGESRKSSSKSRLSPSPDRWREEMDFETCTTVTPPSVDATHSKEIPRKNTEQSQLMEVSAPTPSLPLEKDGSGDHKLVSEYEEFLKMVSFDAASKNNDLPPLYEGPKPPPPTLEGPKPPPPKVLADKLYDDDEEEERGNRVLEKSRKSPASKTLTSKSVVPKLTISRDTNLSPNSNIQVNLVDMEERQYEEEEEFDIDKFFMKEKEKKLKKMAENELTKKKNELLTAAPALSEGEIESEVETPIATLMTATVAAAATAATKRGKKKHNKKEKATTKKKKLAVKVKKLSAKNNKKKQKDRKKKYESSSDSASDSSDVSDSDDSNSSDESVSSSSSSSSTSSSSSSDNSSSDSASHRKRKRNSKKVKKKDKKAERKYADKSKKKKKKLKPKELDIDVKKKKRKSSLKNEDKKKKLKKLPPENILELLLKKNEADENDFSKKIAKEKRKKRKKKLDKDKDDKFANALMDAATAVAGPAPIEYNRQQQHLVQFDEDDILAEMKALDKSSPNDNVKKKKKKSRKKRASSFSEEEAPSWKKKKIVDPREIEESVAKAQMNPFFEVDLDDWDRVAATSAAKHSMRDDSKTELERKSSCNNNTDDGANKDLSKKKKKKTVPKQLKSSKHDNGANKREDKHKTKTSSSHKKKKNKSSSSTTKKVLKKKDKKTSLEKDEKYGEKEKKEKCQLLSAIEKDSPLPSPLPSLDQSFDASSPQLAKDQAFFEDSLVPEYMDQSLDHHSDYKEDRISHTLDKSSESSHHLKVQPSPPLHQPSPCIVDRYSPTGSEVDEEAASVCANHQTETSDNRSYVTTLNNGSYNFQDNKFYSCFSSADLQNISLPSAVPLPVPPPVPVPHPSIQPFSRPIVKEPAAPVIKELPPICNESSISTKISVLNANCSSDFTYDTENEPRPFTKVVVTELDKSAYKSFSVGKLEVKTKAAKKFVHSNIFDSFESEEPAYIEPPLPSKPMSSDGEDVCGASISVLEVSSVLPCADIPEDDTEKEEFQARPCIELPELPLQRQQQQGADSTSSSTVIDTVSARPPSPESFRPPSPSEERPPSPADAQPPSPIPMTDQSSYAVDSKMVKNSGGSPSTNSAPLLPSQEKRSRSRDRSSRHRGAHRSSPRSGARESAPRDSSHRSGGGGSRRSRSRSRSHLPRSRSRSHSHSRSYDRYRKHHFKEQRYSKRGARGRDRSRSRSRSRRHPSRDRDFKEHRYRHSKQRRSYSREPPSSKKSSRRERTPPEMEPPRNPPLPPMPYEDAPPISMMRPDKDERMMMMMEADYERHYSEIRARDSVTELSRRLQHDSQSGAELKAADISALQANLYQLKETLTNLNKKEAHMESLNSMISSLEAHKVPGAGGGRTGTLASGDPRNCSSKSKPQVDIQQIIALCQTIQGSLPAAAGVAAAPPLLQPVPHSVKSNVSVGTHVGAAYGGVGPRSPPDPYVNVKTKKSVADSTNGGYTSASSVARSRFEERSREISPKPLSLDERLELELGVKRTPTTAAVPPPKALPRQLPGAPPPFYPGAMYENGVPNFSKPPPLLHRFPSMPGAADRNYFSAIPPPAMNWNNAPGASAAAPPFVGQNVPKMSPVMLPPGMLPRMMSQQHPSEPKVPYRVPDHASSKVHSIQVGNVLQIVPTELQPPPLSSQAKPPPLPHAPASTPVPAPPTSTFSPAVNSAPAAASFSSLHLPVSFAAAPAVSGSKAKMSSNSRPNEVTTNEQRGVTDSKTKSKEQPPLPLPAQPSVTLPLTGSGGSKITNLPLPPGTTDAEMKKLIRLAREKRLLKLRGVNESPATPTSDDSSLVEDQELNDEPLAPIAIKPSPEQGILISPGFKDKSTPVTALGRSIIGSSRKMVSFVDGVRPGAAAVSDSPPTKVRKPSPPPKKKHKVRVKIIRPEDSDDDDDDPPPPPPPGPPPPELYPPTAATLGLLPPGYILPPKI